MARFSVDTADNYGGQGGGGYFRLKNDHDVARVRFLLDSIEDVEGYAVHKIKYNDKDRYVNCLRDYGQPVDVCPMCKAGYPVQAKYFIPLYNMDTNRVQTWDRGKNFGSKISSLCSRYEHLVTHEFEIERNGKAGDTQTTYEIYPVGQQDNSVSVEDFELPEVFGPNATVMDRSADEMQYYVDYQGFPDADNQPVRRNSRSEETYERRRTPDRRNNDEVY